MKSILVFVILFFIFSLRLEAQEKLIIPFNYVGMSFREFTHAAEASMKVRFFYKGEWTEELTPGNYPGINSLTELLRKMVKGTSVYFYIDRFGNIFLTKSYEIKRPGLTELKEPGSIAPTDLANSGENRIATGSSALEIGNPAEKNRPGNVILSGYVKDHDSKEPVAGVTVFVQKLGVGVLTNEFGYYSISLPTGFHELQFSFIGMKTKKISLNLFGPGEMNMDMNSVLIPLGGAVVTADKNITLQRFEVGAEKVNITTFRLLPTSMGESDILKGILLIPGVQTVGEGSAGFNVRGGSADQNLILLDGAPIYNSSHFFGFFSSVNSDIIKDVVLYKGGIPARFGERISSVLDIVLKEGSSNKFSGNAGISPVTAHLLLEGPLLKDKLSYMFTARTTYSNYILRLIDNPDLNNSKALFNDLNGKISWDINKNNKLNFSAYTSHDAFRFNSDTLYNYRNSIFAIKWHHLFNSRFFSSFSVNNSYYGYDISSQSTPSESFVLSHKLNSTGLKADFNLFMGRNEVNFGTDMTLYSVYPGTYMPESDLSMVKPATIDKERAMEGALYADDKFTLSDFLSVNIGMRLSSYFTFGPEQVFIYNPSYSKSRSTVTDTVMYKAGQVSSAYAGPEFRLSLNFRLSGNSSFKLNYNRTRQYLHLLTNSTSISPTDTWKLSGYYLKPQIGDQVAAGFYQMLINNSIEASAELYYKIIRNMVDFKGGANLIMNENIERDVVNVRGKAYGLELVLKKTAGKLRYTIGYTYSRTFVQTTSSFEEETINSGNWFPSNFDKPHDLTLTFNYIYSRRYSLSWNYTWSTGRPITYPVTVYDMYGNPIINYSDRNKYRIPDYSRFDISLRINGNLKAHSKGHPNWTFSVYNLFGRQNVYSEYFRNVNGHYTAYRLSVFGMAVPSVTFSFDF